MLLVALAAMALVASPPAPPTVAEFSPRAQQQIQDAPDEQSANSGEGPGAAAAPEVIIEEDLAPVSEADGPETIVEVGVPSALSCVTWPDGSVTQTFDPQSPPCIATWGGADGNGGATSMGVTATEIRVAIPVPKTPQNPNGDISLVDRLFEAFLNTHYQFFGRSMRLVAVPYTPGAGAQAVAASVAEVEPFAATDYGAGQPPDLWMNHLARQGIITTTSGDTSQTASAMAAHAPYQWSYSPAIDQVERIAARFVCGSMAGRNAEWAGPGSQGPRKFVITRSQDNVEAGVGLLETLQDGLAACGIEAPVHDYNPDFAQGMAAMFAEFKAQGVTTIIPSVAGDGLAGQMRYADQVGYQPEWFAPGTPFQFTEAAYSSAADARIHRANSTQTAHLFGLAPTNKLLRLTSEPWFLAVKQMDPTYTSAGNVSLAMASYQQLGILAAGIQMAGPDLTPETFAHGLQSTRFPNPGAGQAPYYQAAIDYSSGHSAISDVALWWFDPTQTMATTGERGGGMCWIDRGRRWSLADWPDDLRPFEGDCR